ncbi:MULTISPECIES: rhomboid family intramembrane serine protease [unclassified Lentimonas]|uniref:rhomboid family intramembrane serine protease n=1 Tax=unclassified Lentimonas TaxID=2630993 RepID=UPI001389AD5E|nr:MULTISPECIES: rhomboid family intramembrane serine protease [unclassified Lentimonas]
MAHFINFLRSYWPIAVVFTACIVAFALDALTSTQSNYWMAQFMMVPAEVTLSWQALLSNGFDWSQLNSLSTLLSYAFLHADAEHITMNLIFIWVFGSLVLRELGALWFFIAFILTAITGGMGQVLLEPNSMIPVLGASGALMGLEGIYLGMALRWRLPDPDVWPISSPISQERLMLFAALGILMDVSGIIGNDAGIAFGAHIGGFIGGLFLGTTLIPRPKHAK